MKRALLTLAALLAAVVVTAAPATADPYQPSPPYDPTGCVANPTIPCGPGGNPLVPFWRDSPNGPIIDPDCATFNTCGWWDEHGVPAPWPEDFGDPDSGWQPTTGGNTTTDPNQPF